jgi:pyocin large subunit-like protein
VALRFDRAELAIHFAKHQADFTVTGALAYELEAERFLLSPTRPSLLECKRSGGDLVRYDTATEEFAVLSGAGVIRTYYKPVPCVVRMVQYCHGEPDNVQYFRKTCKL